MMRGMRPPARTSSRMTGVLSSKVLTTSSVPDFVTRPSRGKMSMTSPVLRPVTSISRGRAPESSMVLKKMGAIFPPMQTPPFLMLGTWGMSSPMNQRRELVADLRDEPVPTTSPTYARGWPWAWRSAICLRGPISPSFSGKMPSREFLSIATAWRGMSGRDQASWAGLRSSVLVSPETLKTVTVILSGTSGLVVYHSALAQLSITSVATALPPLCNSSTSWKASNTSRVCLS
mmetsp:Transcript_29886/g.87241  ORF Transcript_29886/g.87241 Transcript_29886/m.87241 type:complete len:232 (+) Transcript_29886:1336-2031(+)